MSRTWLVDVLDRELPHLVGAERDRIATLILEALPLQIGNSVIANKLTHFATYARDVGRDAAYRVVRALGAEP